MEIATPFSFSSGKSNAMERAFNIFAQVQKVEEIDITVEGNEYIDITMLFLLLPNIGKEDPRPEGHRPSPPRASTRPPAVFRPSPRSGKCMAPV
jgi:hypothetical protein